MMTDEEFLEGEKILWSEVGASVTTSPEISEKLASDLRNGGIEVIRVGRKPRSPKKFILFTIKVFRVEGRDQFFLTEEDAQEWHRAKNRGLNTLMKAPPEAFNPIKLEVEEQTIWWIQAYKLAHRTGGISEAKESILKKRGRLIAKNFGI